ncbi:hypothetical protein [Nitrospirillum amazonense]|uniref:Uncharacterized protein n=1 Tax=Nitrospirillum amazonense TaxID=28077 RepID=A0A560JVM7_9PROT|nr:hypothetical protein [Nitrospirillum amazonense]MDG3440548.1 hypothetical protein [Nitrospirillum amazonense]TWB75118.1 hypothetical protein FBZ87_104217 [Nitrospirillum amazonense]
MSLRVAVRRSLMILPVLASATALAVVGAAPAWAQAANPAPGSTPIMPSAAKPSAPAAAAPAAGAKAGAKADDDDGWTCPFPKKVPTIPDGKTAPEADMRKAHEEMQSYVNSGQGFISCVDQLVAQHPDKVTVAKFLQLTSVQDAVVTNMQILAARFNEQLHVFKARTGGAPAPAAPAPAAKPAGK